VKKIAITTAAALVAALSVVASTALAKGGPGVVKTGKCSASSHWKLKAKADDGRIETEFQVDQNRNGKRWRVTLVSNGCARRSPRADRSRCAACSPGRRPAPTSSRRPRL